MLNYIVIFLLTHICLYAQGMNRQSLPKHDLALFKAIGANDINAVKKALSAGVDINAENNDGALPLHVAVQVASIDDHFNLNIVKLLAAHPAIIIDAKGSKWFTPLMDAVTSAIVGDISEPHEKSRRDRLLQVIKILLSHGANPEISQHGISAYVNAEINDPEMFKILKEGRAAYIKEEQKKAITESTGFFPGISSIISDYYDAGPLTEFQEQSERKAEGAGAGASSKNN